MLCFAAPCEKGDTGAVEFRVGQNSPVEISPEKSDQPEDAKDFQSHSEDKLLPLNIAREYVPVMY